MKRREFIRAIGGIAVAWPALARAQQKAMPVIGYLQSGSPGSSASYLAALRRGLGETGYVEGQNLTIEYRWADGNYDRLPSMAGDLVRRNVDVIATGGGPPAALAARDATASIPVVFVVGTDPVELGLVASLARPGRNLTGVSLLLTELNSKRLELLSELVPEVKVIGLLVNPTHSGTNEMIRETQEAARARGLQLNIAKAHTEVEIDAAFAALAKLHCGALLVGNDTFLDTRREQLVALSSSQRIPAIYAWRQFTYAGGLASYGPNLASAYEQAGAYIGRILAGAKPVDLPVMQSTTFELIINLKAAAAIGLAIPPTLLARADEVIE